MSAHHFEDMNKLPEWQYRAFKNFVRLLSYLFYNVYAKGRKNLSLLPEYGPYLMVANHHSVIDALFMGLQTKGKVRFVGRHKTLWKNKFFAKINTLFGTIPVPESRGTKSRVVETAVMALKRGFIIGIFPEGAILRHRKSFEGRTGAARMILEAEVPLVPVGIIGTDGVWPYGAIMPKIGRHVELHFGKPMYFDEFYGQHNNRQITRLVTDIFMWEVRKLSRWYGVPIPVAVELFKRYKKLSEQGFIKEKIRVESIIPRRRRLAIAEIFNY